MTAKVVYVSFIRLTDKVARDWYIDLLLNEGVAVEFWDVVALVREEHTERGTRDAEYVHVVRRYSDLEARLLEPANRNARFVMLVSYAGRFTRLFCLFSRYDCRLYFIAWGAMPHAAPSNSRILASVLKKPLQSARLIYYQTKAAAFRRLGLVKPFDVVFAAGKVLVDSTRYAVRVVPINLCDYDHYVRSRGRADRLVIGSYAVFLNVNLPYQSDLAIMGYPMIDAGRYYSSLNQFFRMLESRHQLRVVIAAHPKADYSDRTFEGRETYRLTTAELVKHAEFVITHSSTALSYAVLNCKPAVFIYTDDMKRAYSDSVIRSMQECARYLGNRIHNIDDATEVGHINVHAVDASRYVRYKYDFLTTPQTENLSTGDIFLRELSAQS